MFHYLMREDETGRTSDKLEFRVLSETEVRVKRWEYDFVRELRVLTTAQARAEYAKWKAKGLYSW